MTHWHSAFFLPWKFIPCNSSTSEQEKSSTADFCGSKGNGHVLKLQSCDFILPCAGRVWSDQSLQTKLSTAVYIWERRELFLWEWCSSGKMPRLAHPCVKHCRHYLAPLPAGQASALVSSLGSFRGSLAGWWKKNHTSLLNESSPLLLTLWTSAAAPVKLDGFTHLY